MNSVNIVAHPDDDLLFLNPDIQEDIDRGDSVCIVYLTCGDDGQGLEYANKRVKAIMRTYPKEVNTLFFMLRSNSFRNGDTYGSLYRLYEAEKTIELGLDQIVWTAESLTRRIRDCIEAYKPDVLRIQDPDAKPAIDHDEPELDHLDHIYGAKFALAAAKSFPELPVYAYTGYPIRYQEPNLTLEQSILKTNLWRKYQEYDSTVSGAVWDIALNRCYKRLCQPISK